MTIYELCFVLIGEQLIDRTTTAWQSKGMKILLGREILFLINNFINL